MQAAPITPPSAPCNVLRNRASMQNDEQGTRRLFPWCVNSAGNQIHDHHEQAQLDTRELEKALRALRQRWMRQLPHSLGTRPAAGHARDSVRARSKEVPKMVEPKVALVLSALGLAVLACSHDRPANDASNANGADNTGTPAPSGSSTPSDD